jgi:chemotaxis protein methyltransferase CheR
MAFTFFFRDQPVLDQAVRNVLPLISGTQRPVIWDAGCAMGPEPYTLTILLAEAMNQFAFRNLQVVASDIDESGQFGENIVSGEYPKEMLDRIPTDLFHKYFEPVEGKQAVFRVIERVRSRIRYMRHDLRSLKPAVSGVSLIVCKNVLLHLTQEERIAVIRMFHGALVPGGILAMDQTQKIPDEISALFEKVASDAQVFCRREIK